MRNSLIWLVKLVLTAAILVAIAKNLDIERISHTLASAPPAAIAAGLLISLLQMVLAAKRLSLVIATFSHRIPLRDALRVTLEGMFFGQTFVSFLGGDAQRTWQIHKCGFTLRDAASAIALDRFVGIMGNHLFVLVCTPYLLFTIASHSIRIGLFVVAGGGLGAIVLVLAFGFLRGRMESNVLQWLQSKRILRLLFEVSTVGRHLFVRDGQLFLALGISVVIAMANSLIFFLVLLAWHIPPIQAFGCALLVPAVMEIAMLPISVAGWGVREGTVIFAFASFGVSAEISFGSSIIFALIMLAVGLLGGLIWFFDRRKIATLIPIEMDINAPAEKDSNAAAQ